MKSVAGQSSDIWSVKTPYKYTLEKMIKNDSLDCFEFIKLLEDSQKIYSNLNYDTDLFKFDDKMVKNDSLDCFEFIKLLEDSRKILNYDTDLFKIDDKMHEKYRSLMLVNNDKLFKNCHLYLSEGDEIIFKKQIISLNCELSKFINLGDSYYKDNKLKSLLDRDKSIDTIFTILMVNIALITFLSVKN